MSRRNLELLIDSSLQVLIQQRLELLVLLIEKTCLLNKVLSIHQHLVVPGQGLVQCSPHGSLLVAQDCRHLLPVDLLLLLLS